jgi:HK97 family phage portal protein
VNFFKKLFSAKESSFGSMLSSWNLNRPVWQEKDFNKLSREGYQQNVVVYSCIWLISKSAADIPIKVFKTTGKTKKQIIGSDIEILLNRPNPMQDGVSFFQSIFSDFLISGNAFIESVDISNTPNELYRIQPDFVRVVPGSKGVPSAYEITINGNMKRIAVDFTKKQLPIMHWKDYHPTNNWYGMSCLDPAAFAVDSHTSSLAWSKALLDNSAQPSGALIYSPKEGSQKLTDDQFTRLKKDLDSAFTGSKNAGKPLLLDGGLEWREMGFSPKEMAFVDGKNSASRDIALCVGVPPLLLGIPGDNTFSNYTEANKAFYRQTILPLSNQFIRLLSYWLSLKFGKEFSIELDIDNISVFSDERESYWNRTESSTILTVNEKRKLLGFDNIAGGDVLLVSSSMIPIESASTIIEGGQEPNEIEDE